MAGVDVAVVGDSLAMIAHGHPSTIPATMDMMVMHAQAIRRGAPNTFVLGCMPYQSYNTVDRALVNATRFMQEAGTDAVKPQGGKSQAHILKALVDAGIPTASHIGLTPHTIAMFGGFKIQGRTADAAMKILEDALAIEDAGCFMLEFEAVPAKIAKLISEQLTIPTIGIGAGVGTDGQILLCHDLLGVFTDFKPKFTKRFAKLTEVAVDRHQAIHQGGEGGRVPRRRPLLYREGGGVREVRQDGPEAPAGVSLNSAQSEQRVDEARAEQMRRTKGRRSRRGDPDRAGLSRSWRSRSSRCSSQPGDVRLRAGAVAELGIGRTPIREALQRLAREGLVTDPAAQGHPRLRNRSQEAAARAGGAPRARAAARAGSAPSAPARSSASGSARSPTAWTAPPRPTTTSPSCGSTAS